MSKSPEEVRKRLENIQTIEPLLSALRTISLANWNQAINRQNFLTKYVLELNNIFEFLSVRSKKKYILDDNSPQLCFIIGSNRGLCGKFNKEIADFAIQELSVPIHDRLKTVIFGERLIKIFKRKKYIFNDIINSQNTGVLNFSQFIDLIKNFKWVEENTKVFVIYNHYKGAGLYQPINQSIYPQVFIHNTESNNNYLDDYIVDTDNDEIYSKLNSQLAFLSLYSAMLSSSAAEHSARFQLMENASKNAGRISEELEIEVQLLRRQKITSEMSELAVGAGLLKNMQ